MSVLSKNLHIGSTYAVKRDGELKRFRVTSIVSTKTGNSPSNIDIKVNGILEGVDGVTTVPKASVLGEYTQYTELVERRKQEEAARDLKFAARAELAAKAKSLLTDLGVPSRDYSYSGDLLIDDTDMPAFVKLLEGMKHEAP